MKNKISNKEIKLPKKGVKAPASERLKKSDADGAEVNRISLALEAARQTVKPLVKRLVEAEAVDEALMNLRLKNR